MVKAGDPTDAVIQEFAPLLEEGDVIIDGGNAHFEDTRRRERGAARARDPLRRGGDLRRRGRGAERPQHHARRLGRLPLALNTIVENGAERDIVRANMPFGSFEQGEFGTYYIGYAADPGVTEQMLRNMFLGKGAGSHDRILDFSTAVTGSSFFAPRADFLDSPPPPPGPRAG
ncbi:hypothetical protein SCALM49S_09713 [Streptomyces californicus]